MDGVRTARGVWLSSDRAPLPDQIRHALAPGPGRRV